MEEHEHDRERLGGDNKKVRQPKLSALQNANSDCRQTSLYREQFYDAHILEFALLPNPNMNIAGAEYTAPFNSKNHEKTVRLLYQNINLFGKDIIPQNRRNCQVEFFQKNFLGIL